MSSVNKSWMVLLVLLLSFLPVLPDLRKACRSAGLSPVLPVLGLGAGVLAEVWRDS
jgi:hypothetical protein